MTSKDKPTFGNVIFGHFNSRCLELTHIFERGLVFKCHKNLRRYNEVKKVGTRPGVTSWEPQQFLKASYVAKMCRNIDEKLKAGGLLRASTRPTLNPRPLLILRVCM